MPGGPSANSVRGRILGSPDLFAMLAVTADETGLVKLVNLKKKTTAARCGVQSRQHGVKHLAWIPGSTTQVAALSRSGVIKVWDTLTETSSQTCVGAGEDGALLHVLPAAYLTCTGSGTVRVLPRAASGAATHEVSEFVVRLCLGRTSTPHLFVSVLRGQASARCAIPCQSRRPRRWWP